ncbi:Protein tyrosine phosphatase domain-containing protein 1, partial [Clarias magur]
MRRSGSSDEHNAGVDDDLMAYESLFRGARSSWPGFRRAEGRLTAWNGPHYKSTRNAWAVGAARQLGHDPRSRTHCSRCGEMTG